MPHSHHGDRTLLGTNALLQHSCEAAYPRHDHLLKPCLPTQTPAQQHHTEDHISSTGTFRGKSDPNYGSHFPQLPSEQVRCLLQHLPRLSTAFPKKRPSELMTPSPNMPIFLPPHYNKSCFQNNTLKPQGYSTVYIQSLATSFHKEEGTGTHPEPPPHPRCPSTCVMSHCFCMHPASLTLHLTYCPSLCRSTYHWLCRSL